MRWSTMQQNRRQCWGWVALAALFLVTSAAPALAQFERAQISGVAKDDQGGVMPGVTVTATSQATGQASTVVTDGSGFYTFASLIPGKYNLVAELTGFKKVVRNDVQLDAAGQIRYDVTLAAGDLTEEVTVTAETQPLQTDVALRKTIEAKDIEQIPFSGRNPIGVAGLKAGVVGGSFNNNSFSSLTNGGFSINGGRTSDNNITVDGATAIRTRAAGAAIGVQNVDAIQEVQVLTGNYMPEFGRSSAGQIRIVTKSGGNRYSGSLGYYYRDDKLQANTFTRNKSSNATENSGAAPFDFKQYGYAFGGPTPGLKDKLFFFGAQEWVNYLATNTNTATVPSMAMRNGDFSELLNPSNAFYGKVVTIMDPLTGQPFPNNVIPTSRLSANGLAFLRAYPTPTAGFQQGTANAVISSPNPQDQRKDNIRLDYRMNNKNQFTFRYSRYEWTAIDSFRGTFTYARTDWSRPNWTTTASWTSTLTNNLLNEASYNYSKDQVFINVATADGAYQRSKYGINYPYIFPDNKEINDKVPTIQIGTLSTIDGGPYPSSSQGPIHTFADTLTWVKGRHTFKAGASLEYSGEDDFDQINVNSVPGGTNNQNGSFNFTDTRGVSAGGSGNSIANAALGLYTDYAELGQRAFTQWRSLALDTFVQDSWKPTDKLTLEGGVRYVLWPPWYSTTNNIANFEPGAYSTANAAIINPTTGRLVGGSRFNGIVLPGDGFLGNGNDLVAAQDPRVQALFNGSPRGFSETHYNAFEPRGGAAYALNDKTVLRASAGIFHTRVSLNDSTLLGGNPPFQPMVTVSNGTADNPAGVGGSATDLPFGMTAQDLAFKLPTAYMWSGGVQREIPFGFILDVTYVGRRGIYLQRERNINQTALGATYANPAVNVAALRPYLGYGVLRLSENAGSSKYNSLQISADRRYSNGLKFGAAYTYGKSTDNGSDNRAYVWNTADDTNFYGNSNYDRRHVLNFYYIYDLPFFKTQDSLLKNLAGGWQVSGATFYRTGNPFSVTVGQDIAGIGDTSAQPYNVSGDILSGANRNFSGAVGDGNFLFNTAAYTRPANGTWGNQTRNQLYYPGEYQWDIALFKNFNAGGSRRIQFRAEMFNFLNHPNLNNTSGREPNVNNPTNAGFGRITGKTDDRRDVQLSLRYIF
jgi:hypothetical protein